MASRRISALGVPFLLLATLAQVGVSVTQQGIAVLSFAFRSHLSLSLAQSGTLVSATSLGVMAAMLLGGSATDRYGPRPVLIASACLGPVAALALTFAHGYGILLVALALVGLSIGAVPVAGSRAVFFRFSGPWRGTAMGIRQTGVTFGAALAAATLPAYVALHGPFSPWLFLSLIASALGIAFALQTPATPRSARAAAPSQLGGDLALLAFPALIGFVLAAGQYGLLTYTVGDQSQFVGLAGAGLLLAISQIGGVTGRIVFGALSDRLGGRPAVVAISSGLGALGILLAPGLGPGAPYPLRVALYFVAGTGAMGWNAVLLTWAAERVAPERAARAIGFIAASIFAGSIAFPPLIGLLAATSGFPFTWAALASMLALAAAAALVGGRSGAGTGAAPRK